MSEISEPNNGTTEKPQSNVIGRILITMTVLLCAGIAGSFYWLDWRITLGIAAGGALSFLNFYWLRASLGKMLGLAAAGTSEPTGLWLVRHNLRFLFLIIAIMVVSVTGVVSLPAFFGGLLSLAGAIVVEGFIQLFLAVFKREEV